MLSAISELLDRKLSSELQPIKHDLAGLKQEFGGMKQDMAGLKQEFGSMKQDMTGPQARAPRYETGIARRDPLSRKFCP